MTCEYCGKYISNQMTECPHCGAANPVYKQTEDELVPLKEKEAELQTKLEDMKLAKETEQQETVQAAYDIVKMSAICSVFTSIATTAVFSANHDIDFIPMLLVFYFGNLIGNGILFAILNVLKSNKFVQLIFCAGFMVLGSLMFSSGTSSSNTTDYSDYTRVTHTEKVSVITSDYDKPVDGMTLEQVQDLNWGILILNKCRDFDHLRVKNIYYEAKWFNSKGDKIGSGLIVYDSNDESDTRLVYFHDYTEDL